MYGLKKQPSWPQIWVFREAVCCVLFLFSYCVIGLCSLCLWQGSLADYEKAIQASKAAWQEWAEVSILHKSWVAHWNVGGWLLFIQMPDVLLIHSCSPFLPASTTKLIIMGDLLSACPLKGTRHFTMNNNNNTSLSSFIYPLTMRVVGAPQVISQPVSSIFPLFSTALLDLVDSRPVHSLMLSSHLFLCLHCLLPPFTVPYNI